MGRTINQLSSISAFSSDDQLLTTSSSNNDVKNRLPVNSLLDYAQDNFTFDPERQYFQDYITQYLEVEGDSFNVQVNSPDRNNGNVHLIITGDEAISTGTITFPPKEVLIDQQEILVNSTQPISTLTIDTNGVVNIAGDLTSLGENGFFMFMYNEGQDIWLRGR